MARYRFLLLNAAGAVQDVVCKMFETAEAAFDYARLSMGNHSAVEVWNETVFLGVSALALEPVSQPTDESNPLLGMPTSQGGRLVTS